MGIVDALKGMVHAVTGKAADIELKKYHGKLAPEAMIFVRVVVTANRHLTSDGVFVDMHGEDDLEENVVQKLAEVFKPDPELTYRVSKPFELQAGESKTFENVVGLPASFDTKRTWLIRARVEAFGNDPDTGFMIYEEGKHNPTIA